MTVVEKQKAYLIRDLKRGYWTKRGYTKSPDRAQRFTKDEAQKAIGSVDDDVVVEEIG